MDQKYAQVYHPRLLLTPNSFLHPAFGKALFAACDLAVGVQLALD